MGRKSLEPSPGSASPLERLSPGTGQGRKDLGAADELCPVKIHQKHEGSFTRKRPVKRKQEMRQDLIFFERLNMGVRMKKSRSHGELK